MWQTVRSVLGPFLGCQFGIFRKSGADSTRWDILESTFAGLTRNATELWQSAFVWQTRFVYIFWLLAYQHFWICKCVSGTWTLFDWLVLSTYAVPWWHLNYMKSKEISSANLSSVTSKATTSPTHVYQILEKVSWWLTFKPCPPMAQSNQPLTNHASIIAIGITNVKCFRLVVGHVCLFLNLTTWKSNFQPPTTVNIWEKICLNSKSNFQSEWL